MGVSLREQRRVEDDGLRVVNSFREDKRLNHQIQVTSGVLKEECRSLMQSFFRMKRLKMCL